MDAAFEQGDLPAAEGAVHLGQTDIAGTAVVRSEQHQRVALQSVILQRVEHTSDAAVEAADHGRINAFAVVLDMG